MRYDVPLPISSETNHPEFSLTCLIGCVGLFVLPVQLSIHGCFLIFSKHYIDVFDGLYDKTFLYGEEILLKLRCERAGMKMWFLSDLKALHNESQTEKYIGGKVNEKHRRRYINVLNSMVLVKEYIEDENII